MRRANCMSQQSHLSDVTLLVLFPQYYELVSGVWKNFSKISIDSEINMYIFTLRILLFTHIIAPSFIQMKKKKEEEEEILLSHNETLNEKYATNEIFDAYSIHKHVASCAWESNENKIQVQYGLRSKRINRDIKQPIIKLVFFFSSLHFFRLSSSRLRLWLF